MKILIVDDKKENLSYLETLLKGFGYETISAENGKEALEKLRSDVLNMIISDILMPEMDGYQLLINIKGDNNLKDIPFVLYTATYTSDKDKELGLKLGVDKYIQKPIDPEKFIKIIQDIIRSVESGEFKPKKPLIEEEVFKLYSERLVNKLEKKMFDLEKEIKERKQAEEVLHQYEHIVSSSTDMLALLDKRFNYLATNKTYIEAFKFTREQVIGKTVTEVFGKEFFNTVIKPNADRCLGGEEVNYQDWFNFPAYGQRYMDITYYPYYNKDNKIMGFVVNGRNITERKQIEDSLKERVKELQCLYSITEISERPGMTLEKLFQEAVNLIPPGWQYPEITGSRITFGEKIFKADNFKKTKWLQKADIHVKNESVGTVEICYLKEKPDKFEGPFLKEERDLINAIAKQFGGYIQSYQAKEKEVHLNTVLRSIRNVNQLITKEKDLNKLIKGACENLVRIRGYQSTWIALLDNSSKLSAFAESGIGKISNSLVELFKKGALPLCGLKALKQSDVLVINKPDVDCSDCPIRSIYPDNVRMTLRLKYGGKVYGLMSVSVPSGITIAEEEKHLFKEVAEDISFALHNLEREEIRKQAELKLRESEEKFRNIAENFPNGAIVLYDHDLRYLLAEGEIIKKVGLTREMMVGNTLRNLMTDEYYNALAPYYKKALKGETHRFEFEFGGIIHDTATLPVKDSDGNITAGMSISLDITERKKAEEELEKHRYHLEELVRERTAELEEKNKELKRFNKLFVGREFRIKELKDKVKELEKESGRKI
jgi:PAS domain S-box-containing protein